VRTTTDPNNCLLANQWQPLAVRPAIVPAYRNYATSSEPDLKATFKEVLPAKRELLKKVKAHSGKVIGDVKIENTLGGMR
jgi:citrate synthase